MVGGLERPARLGHEVVHGGVWTTYRMSGSRSRITRMNDYSDDEAPGGWSWDADDGAPDGWSWEAEVEHDRMLAEEAFAAEVHTGVHGRPSVGWIELTDITSLSEFDLVDFQLAVERTARYLAAVRAEILVVRHRRDPDNERCTRQETACLLGISEKAALNGLETAQVMFDRLPSTLKALRAGTISAKAAEAIVDATDPLTDDQLISDLETFALGKAEQILDPTRFRNALMRRLHRIDPSTQKERHAKAKEKRRVELWKLDDGMSALHIVAPAQECEGVFTRVQAGMRMFGKKDERTADQKRCDILVDAIYAGLPGDALPTEQGRKPTVNVVVNLETLLGLNDEPGWLNGYGPITADTARMMAADPTGTWCRLITDQHGQLLDFGTKTYRPPQNLVDFVIARDTVAAIPYNNNPAARLDLDHIEPWTGTEDGGQTSAENLAPLPRSVHIAKTVGFLSYQRNEDGTYTWTFPSGHTYVSVQPQRWATPEELRELDTTLLGPEPPPVMEDTTPPPF